MKKSNLVVATAASAGLCLSAFAGAFPVSSVAELRAAIANTTDVPDGSTIVLKASGTHYDVSADGQGPIVINRELTLKGETDNPRDTVLSGGGVINVLEVTGENSLVTGLTVTNGLAKLTDKRMWYSGGGIYMSGETVVVSNCVATGCHFDTRTDYLEGDVVAKMTRIFAAGVHVRGSSLLADTLVENCILYNDKTAKVAANGAGIVVEGTDYGSTTPSRAINCEVRNCHAETLSNGGGTSVLAGGGMSVGDKGRASRCRVHRNVLRAADGGGRGYGGGLLLTAGGVASNSIIYCNTNWAVGGGGCSIEGSGVLSASTVSNNYAVGDGGGIFHVNNPSGGLRDCLIVDNRAEKCGGGGSGNMASTGCHFLRNVAKTQSGAWDSTKGQGWFSNCVFEANTTESMYGEAKSLCVSVSQTPDVPPIIEGCWFVNHEISDSKSVVLMKGSPSESKYRGRVRNCVFANNPGGTAFNVNCPEYGPVIDNCTFVGDDTWNYAIPAATSKRETKIIVRNSLFTGWKNGGLAPNLALEMPASVSNNYDMVSTTLPKDADGKVINGNLSGTDVGEPCFADAANLNLTLTKKSPLIGKGLVLDWMTNEDGAPNAAARDAGCGTYEVEKVADYGIRINFGKKSHPRYTGGADRPDIGAYEYAPVLGLMLMVK